MTTATNGTATDVGFVGVLPTPADAPDRDTLDAYTRGIFDAMNPAGPIEPGTLHAYIAQEWAKDGTLKAEYTVLYSSDHTTVDAPSEVYAGGLGKAVISGRADWTDTVLHRLAMVRGGTVAYIPLPVKRDDAGFRTLDRKIVSKFRRAVERLATTDRAAHNRFAYDRFKVLPTADGTDPEIGGYLKLVFTGRRVK